MLDTTKSIGRVTGTVTIGTDPFTGTFTVPGYSGATVIWFIAQFSTTLGDPPAMLTFGEGSYSVAGDVVSWEAYWPSVVVYGVY